MPRDDTAVEYQRQVITKQRALIHDLIRTWPGGHKSVSFAGVARQVREVIGDASYEWEELGGPPPKGRCSYEQYEPDNSDSPITEQQALEGINAIRNSIIGAQTFNWSEHAYPLVSLLNRAGYEGLPYPQARANVGTLLDRIARLEKVLQEAQTVIEKAIEDECYEGRTAAEVALSIHAVLPTNKGE